jgi:hypothetical protein
MAPITPEQPTVGKIVINTAPITAKVLAKTYDDSANVDIDFGLIKSTKSFYLIIKNVGGAPIENLTIASDFEQVEVTPGKIAVLETDGNAAMTQIIAVEAIHGLDQGTGSPSKPLMPYGKTEFTISFTGTSAGEPFEAKFTFAIRAIYAEFVQEKLGDPMPYLDSINAQYLGDSCMVYHPVGRNQIFFGETVPGSTQGDGTLNSNFVYNSDCVIKNNIPKIYQ